jgi:heptosyltransferase-3
MKRILVVVTRQIGDVLLTTPLIRATRARWPQAQLDVAAFAGTLAVLEGNPDIDGRIPMASRLGWRGAARLIHQLWRRYDLALVADPGDRAHWIGWFAAQRRAGLVSHDARGHGLKAATLSHAVPIAGDRGDRHVILEKLQLLAPWGNEPSPDPQNPPAPAVRPPAARSLPAPLAARLPSRYVVVHAPSMWRYKQWPPDHFAALVRGLLEAGQSVVLTGADTPRDQACIETVRAAAHHEAALLDASGQLDFGQLTTLLQGCALYIGPDTSVTHLAAACGARVLALFGPTNPQRWGPWPADASVIRFERRADVQQAGNVRLLQGAQSCVPCGRAGCEDHHHSASECLESIRPEAVLKHALALLGDGRDPYNLAS